MRRLALLLAVLLPALAVAAAPGVEELLPLVPADAKVVVAVDGAALKNHPKVQEWLLEHQAPWSGVNDEGANFLREAGLDPLHDVDAMVVALTFAGDEERLLALFSGRYDPASLGAALVKEGATRLTLSGREAYRLRDHSDDSAEELVFAPSADLVICGSEPLVAAALAARGGGSTLVRVEIAAGHVNPAAPFWMAVAVPDVTRQNVEHGHGPAGDDSALRGVFEASRAVRRVSGWATVDDSLTFHGFALADTTENAELLRDAVKGALAALRLEAQGTADELVDVLREVKVELDGVNVAVHASVPVALLEKLAGQHGHECESGHGIEI
jgi:hypothetical protein